MAVWDKYGLVSSGFLSGRARDPRYSSLPRATRFRLALEERGGLFVLYGRFLSGRADILPNPHLRQLRKAKAHRVPSGTSTVDRALVSRVGELGSLGSAPGADLFAGTYQGKPVVVEFYSHEADPLPKNAWKEFVREIRILDDEIESHITGKRVLSQFEEWLGLARDIGRKRSILENLDLVPAGCVTRFPRLIPDLQTENC